MAGIRNITCSKCGHQHYHRSKCRCESASHDRSSLRKKIEFMALWLFLVGGTAVLVTTLVLMAGREYGEMRGTLVAAAILGVLVLLMYGFLFEDANDGHSDFDFHNQILSNVLGGFIETFHDLIMIREFFRMDRPWFKAVAIGGTIGVVISLSNGIAMLSGKPATAAAMVGQQMPNVELPVAGGGEFTGEDLLGKTSVVMIRASRGGTPDDFLAAWDASVEAGENNLDLMVLIMDQYGDVKSYETGDWVRFKHPMAVGRKWMREWFGGFEGRTLVLVVGPQGDILGVYEDRLWQEQVAQGTLDQLLRQFADR